MLVISTWNWFPICVTCLAFSWTLLVSNFRRFAAVTTFQSTTDAILNIMSLTKRDWTGVAWIVQWEESLIAHAIYASVSPHGYIYSKTLLSRYLVTRIFNITWCTCSTGALVCEFLIVVNTSLIPESFSKGVKFCLNPDPLSNLTSRGNGYLLSRVLLNNWIILANDLYTYSSLLPVTSSRLYVDILMI